MVVVGIEGRGREVEEKGYISRLQGSIVGIVCSLNILTVHYMPTEFWDWVKGRREKRDEMIFTSFHNILKLC